MMYWARYITNILLTGSIIIGGYSAIEYSYVRWVSDFDDYITYNSIKPERTFFIETDEITFISDLEVKRQTGFEAIHELRCNEINEDDVFTFYSSQTNEIGVTAVGKHTGKFSYTTQKPQPPRTCYLKSTIKIKLPYGVEKEQVLIGENFNII